MKRCVIVQEKDIDEDCGYHYLSGLHKGEYFIIAESQEFYKLQHKDKFKENNDPYTSWIKSYKVNDMVFDDVNNPEYFL